MSWQKKIGVGVLLTIAYSTIAILITWPLAQNLTQVLPGPSEDTVLHYWNGWVTGQAFAQGQSPYFTTQLFYPEGVSLVTQNLAWFQILPWVALSDLIDGIMAYNIVLLFNLVLCGLAAFLLTYKLTQNGRSAFLAGLIYMAWPFRMSQLDHPNLIATQWIPLFLLFLILLLENGRWRNAVFTGFFFALIGYTRWQLLIPALLMGGIYALWQWRKWWPKTERVTLIKLLAAGGLAIVLLLPPAFLLVREQLNDPGAADVLLEGEEAIMQTDPLAYLTPSNAHFLLRDTTKPLYDTYYAARYEARRYSPYIGLIVLILVITAVFLKRRQTLPWLIMALLLMLLALGSELRFNGQTYANVPTLYRLLEPLQLFRLMRIPDRYNMFLALPIAVMAAYGTLAIFERIKKPLVQNLVALGFGLLILLEYLAVPAPMYALRDSSSWYDEIANESGEFAILNLPIDYLDAKWYMYAQTSHQRPIMQGNMSRIPPGAYVTINDNPLLNSLRYTSEIDPALTNVSEQLADLAALGTRYIVLHKDRVGWDRILHWQRYLLHEPIYEDDRIIVYRTEATAGEDFALQAELQPGLGPVRVMTGGECVQNGRSLAVNIGWGTNQPFTQNVTAQLSLQSNDGEPVYTQSYPLMEDESWPTNMLLWQNYLLDVPDTVNSDDYELVLQLVDGVTGDPVGESMVLQPVQVETAVCTLATIPQANNINASFGTSANPQMRLAAYTLQQEGPLNIKLYWLAEQPMAQDYKVFIHVFDPATGIPVAQDDAMPHRNAYATRYWGLEEIVEDPITIYLDGVAPGTYGVAIGVYDAATGDRLTAVDGEGNIFEDGRLILPETIVSE